MRVLGIEFRSGLVASVSTEPSCWPGQPSLYGVFLNSCKHLSQTPLWLWLWLGLLMATLWMLHTVVISMFLLLSGSCCSEKTWILENMPPMVFTRSDNVLIFVMSQT